jgi:hypothetical protein
MNQNHWSERSLTRRYWRNFLDVCGTRYRVNRDEASRYSEVRGFLIFTAIGGGMEI